MIGSALVPTLIDRGHTVHGLARRQSPEAEPFWDPGSGRIDLGHDTVFDVVIHLAGENIAQGRWNAQKKARIEASRVKGTRLLAGTLAQLKHKPSVLISASAIGYYGDRGDEMLSEDSAPGQGFLAQVCQQWEAATQAAQDCGMRVALLRLGVVLSRTGGALQTMLKPFRMGLGGRIGSGNQFMSWIGLADVIEVIHLVMQNDKIAGPVNLVSPQPVTNAQFTQALGKVLGRPTVFPLPAAVARLVIGEMADALLLTSARVQPKKLIDLGYAFRHPDLDTSLEALIGK